MLSKTSLLWLGVSTSIVLAGPMRVPVTQDDVEELMRRLPKDEKQDKIGALWDEFPACTKENDPSYATEKSKYEDKGDDYGISIGSSCDDDTWNNYWKCWTDYFFVEWEYEYTNWENTGLDIDCATTSNCNRQASDAGQDCTSFTTSWDIKGGGEVEGKIEGKAFKYLEKIAEKWGVGVKLKIEGGKGEANGTQTCSTNTNSARCTWDDKKCHAFWTAKRNHRVHGYTRRSCSRGRSGNRINHERKPGYWTVGMRDFSVSIPDSKLVGCAAKCGATSYPDKAPTGDTSMVPIEGL